MHPVTNESVGGLHLFRMSLMTLSFPCTHLFSTLASSPLVRLNTHLLNIYEQRPAVSLLEVRLDTPNLQQRSWGIWPPGSVAVVEWGIHPESGDKWWNHLGGGCLCVHASVGYLKGVRIHLIFPRCVFCFFNCVTQQKCTSRFPFPQGWEDRHWNGINPGTTAPVPARLRASRPGFLSILVTVLKVELAVLMLMVGN